MSLKLYTYSDSEATRMFVTLEDRHVAWYSVYPRPKRTHPRAFQSSNGYKGDYAGRRVQLIKDILRRDMGYY